MPITIKSNLRSFLTDMKNDQLKLSQLRDRVNSADFKVKAVNGVAEIGHAEIKHNFDNQKSPGNRKWSNVMSFDPSSKYAKQKTRRAQKGYLMQAGSEKLLVKFPASRENVGKLTGKIADRVFNNRFIEVIKKITQRTLSLTFQIRNPMQYQHKARNYMLRFLAHGNNFMFFRKAAWDRMTALIDRNIKQQTTF